MFRIIFFISAFIGISIVMSGQQFMDLDKLEVCLDNDLLMKMVIERNKYSALDTMDELTLSMLAAEFREQLFFKEMDINNDSISSSCYVLMYAFAIEYYLELGWKPYYDYKNKYCGQSVVWGDIPEPCFQKGLLSSIYFVSRFRKKMHKRMTHGELSKLLYEVLQGGIFKHSEVIMDVLLNFDFDKASRDANERRR